MSCSNSSWRRGGVVLDGAVLLEEVRRHLVHRHIGGLGGEHHRHEQLPIVAEVQHDVGVGILAAKAADDLQRLGFPVGHSGHTRMIRHTMGQSGRGFVFRRPVRRAPSTAQLATRVIVGITGASGTIYGVRLLEVLQSLGVETHLVMTEAARRVAGLETGYSVADIEALATYSYANDEIAAPIASGSFRTGGHDRGAVLHQEPFGRWPTATTTVYWPGRPTSASRSGASWCWWCARLLCTWATCG